MYSCTDVLIDAVSRDPEMGVLALPDHGFSFSSVVFFFLSFFLLCFFSLVPCIDGGDSLATGRAGTKHARTAVSVHLRVLIAARTLLFTESCPGLNGTAAGPWYRQKKQAGQRDDDIGRLPVIQKLLGLLVMDADPGRTALGLQGGGWEPFQISICQHATLARLGASAGQAGQCAPKDHGAGSFQQK